MVGAQPYMKVGMSARNGVTKAVAQNNFYCVTIGGVQGGAGVSPAFFRQLTE